MNEQMTLQVRSVCARLVVCALVVTAAVVVVATFVGPQAHSQGGAKPLLKIVDTSAGVLLFEEGNGITFKLVENTPGFPVWQQVTNVSSPKQWALIDRFEHEVVLNTTSLRDGDLKGVMLRSSFDDSTYTTGPAGRGPKTLMAGDVIVELNGQQVADVRALVLALANARSADEISVKVDRSGEELSFSLETNRRVAIPSNAR